HVADPDGLKRYNSAAFVRPDLGYVGRFDKMHRVVFGEYVPLRSVLPFLQSLTPYNSAGIDAGTSPKIFDSGGYRYAPLICFEDTIPRLVRQIVNFEPQDAEKPDVLVNLTNDSWFHGSSELDQHLITAAFRCVETRRPMVRAVNGGISAVIDGDGAILEPEKLIDRDAAERAEMGLLPRTSMRDETTGEFHRQFNGVLIRTVPLDPRTSLYVRWGDWFGNLCLLACGLIVVAGTVLRLRGRSKAKTPAHPALA
ncbi:MAG: apolipoprotein N-acyltransferase, partial [Planctomycetaceae bacterium]|nr:apolipoprotein N-acyltransferase [Planctomycetaceae bacterium]